MSSDTGTSVAQLITERHDGVGWILFDNARRLNALTPEMLADFRGAIEKFAADDEIRVVVVRGAGDRAFCAGGDLSNESFRDRAQRATGETTFPVPDKPVIAMIHGVCIGAGLGVALSADIRIAAEDARFSIPVARLGFAYPLDIMRRVVSLVGPSAASMLAFTADVINAQEALRIGLVDRVVAKDALHADVAELAQRITKRAPLSVRASKVTIRAISGDQPGDLERSKQMIAACTTSDDAVEGRTAFLEKREARFQGR
jgi:enoyl-CoA hydratase/carnithine racemase